MAGIEEKVRPGICPPDTTCDPSLEELQEGEGGVCSEEAEGNATVLGGEADSSFQEGSSSSETTSWKMPVLFQENSVSPEEIPMVEDGDSLVRVTTDGYSIIGRIQINSSDDNGVRIEIQYDAGVLSPNIGTALTLQQLTTGLRANGLEVWRLKDPEHPVEGFRKVVSVREQAEEMAQQLDAARKLWDLAARYSTPDGRAVFRLRDHLTRLIEDQSRHFTEYREDWFERFKEGANAALGSSGIRPFSHGESWYKIADYREEIEITQGLIAEIEAGMLPDLSKISDLPPAVRAILSESFEQKKPNLFTTQTEAVQGLRAEERYEEALLLAMGVQWSYRNLNEEGYGSIERNIEGEISPLGRLNNLIQNGAIEWDHPILFASDLADPKLRRAIQIYRINHDKKPLPDGQYELALSDAELDKEMVYLQRLEALHPTETAEAQKAARHIEELETIIGVEKAKEFAKIFAEGLYDTLTDPATLIMVVSGMGAGAVGRSVVVQLLKRGVPRLAASAIALTVEGIVFHNTNNAGTVFIHPEVLAEYGSLDRIVYGNLHSTVTLGWLKGVGKVWGRFAELVLLRLKNTQQALFTALNASGSFTSEAFAFTAQSLFERSLDPTIDITWELVAEELASSVQMVIAFKAFHAVEGGLLDKSHRNRPATERAYAELGEAVAKQRARFEATRSPADEARLRLLEERHEQLYFYHLDDVAVSLRQARAARSLSEEEYQKQRSELGENAEKVRKMSPQQYAAWLKDQQEYQTAQKSLELTFTRLKRKEKEGATAFADFQKTQTRENYERVLVLQVEGASLYLDYLKDLQGQLERQLRLGVGDAQETAKKIEEIEQAQARAGADLRQLNEKLEIIRSMTPEAFEILLARLAAQAELLKLAQEQINSEEGSDMNASASSGGPASATTGPSPLFVDGNDTRQAWERGLPKPFGQRGTFVTNGDDEQGGGGHSASPLGGAADPAEATPRRRSPIPQPQARGPLIIPWHEKSNWEDLLRGARRELGRDYRDVESDINNGRVSDRSLDKLRSAVGSWDRSKLEDLVRRAEELRKGEIEKARSPMAPADVQEFRSRAEEIFRGAKEGELSEPVLAGRLAEEMGGYDYADSRALLAAYLIEKGLTQDARLSAGYRWKLAAMQRGLPPETKDGFDRPNGIYAAMLGFTSNSWEQLNVGLSHLRMAPVAEMEKAIADGTVSTGTLLYLADLLMDTRYQISGVAEGAISRFCEDKGQGYGLITREFVEQLVTMMKTSDEGAQKVSSVARWLPWKKMAQAGLITEGDIHAFVDRYAATDAGGILEKLLAYDDGEILQILIDRGVFRREHFNRFTDLLHSEDPEKQTRAIYFFKGLLDQPSGRIFESAGWFGKEVVAKIAESLKGQEEGSPQQAAVSFFVDYLKAHPSELDGKGWVTKEQFQQLATWLHREGFAAKSQVLDLLTGLPEREFILLIDTAWISRDDMRCLVRMMAESEYSAIQSKAREFFLSMNSRVLVKFVNGVSKRDFLASFMELYISRRHASYELAGIRSIYHMLRTHGLMEPGTMDQSFWSQMLPEAGEPVWKMFAQWDTEGAFEGRRNWERIVDIVATIKAGTLPPEYLEWFERKIASGQNGDSISLLSESAKLAELVGETAFADFKAYKGQSEAYARDVLAFLDDIEARVSADRKDVLKGVRKIRTAIAEDAEATFYSWWCVGKLQKGRTLLENVIAGAEGAEKRLADFLKVTKINSAEAMRVRERVMEASRQELEKGGSEAEKADLKKFFESQEREQVRARRVLYDSGLLPMLVRAATIMDRSMARRALLALTNSVTEDGRIAYTSRYQELLKHFDPDFVAAWGLDVERPVQGFTPGARVDTISLAVQNAITSIEGNLGAAKVEVEAAGEDTSEIRSLRQKVVELVAVMKDGIPSVRMVQDLIDIFEKNATEIENMYGVEFEQIGRDLENLRIGLAGRARIGRESESVRISGDPYQMGMSGHEPEETCQTMLESTGMNSRGQPITRMIHGQFKIAQYIIDGEVVARRHLEITLDNEGNVILLAESEYRANGFIRGVEFKAEILRYAAELGIPAERVYFSGSGRVLPEGSRPLQLNDPTYRDTFRTEKTSDALSQKVSDPERERLREFSRRHGVGNKSAVSDGAVPEASQSGSASSPLIGLQRIVDRIKTSSGKPEDIERERRRFYSILERNPAFANWQENAALADGIRALEVQLNNASSPASSGNSGGSSGSTVTVGPQLSSEMEAGRSTVAEVTDHHAMNPGELKGTQASNTGLPGGGTTATNGDGGRVSDGKPHPYPLPSDVRVGDRSVNVRSLVEPTLLPFLEENIPTDRQGDFIAAITSCVSEGRLPLKPSSEQRRDGTLYAIRQLVGNIANGIDFLLGAQLRKPLPPAKQQRLEQNCQFLSALVARLEEMPTQSPALLSAQDVKDLDLQSAREVLAADEILRTKNNPRMPRWAIAQLKAFVALNRLDRSKIGIRDPALFLISRLRAIGFTAKVVSVRVGDHTEEVVAVQMLDRKQNRHFYLIDAVAPTEGRDELLVATEKEAAESCQVLTLRPLAEEFAETETEGSGSSGGSSGSTVTVGPQLSSEMEAGRSTVAEVTDHRAMNPGELKGTQASNAGLPGGGPAKGESIEKDRILGPDFRTTSKTLEIYSGPHSKEVIAANAINNRESVIKESMSLIGGHGQLARLLRQLADPNGREAIPADKRRAARELFEAVCLAGHYANHLPAAATPYEGAAYAAIEKALKGADDLKKLYKDLFEQSESRAIVEFLFPENEYPRDPSKGGIQGWLAGPSPSLAEPVTKAGSSLAPDQMATDLFGSTEPFDPSRLPKERVEVRQRTNEPPFIRLNESAVGDERSMRDARAALDWGPYQGREVDFQELDPFSMPGDSQERIVRQTVLGSEDLSPEFRKFVTDLAKKTQQRHSVDSEDAVIFIVTNSGTYGVHVRGDDSHVDLAESFDRLLQSIAESNPDTLIRAVHVIHTHPGKGGPLSEDDLVGVKNHASSLQVPIYMYAVPVEDGGQLVFKITADDTGKQIYASPVAVGEDLDLGRAIYPLEDSQGLTCTPVDRSDLGRLRASPDGSSPDMLLDTAISSVRWDYGMEVNDEQKAQAVRILRQLWTEGKRGDDVLDGLMDYFLSLQGGATELAPGLTAAPSGTPNNAAADPIVGEHFKDRRALEHHRGNPDVIVVDDAIGSLGSTAVFSLDAVGGVEGWKSLLDQLANRDQRGGIDLQQLQDARELAEALCAIGAYLPYLQGDLSFLTEQQRDALAYHVERRAEFQELYEALFKRSDAVEIVQYLLTISPEEDAFTGPLERWLQAKAAVTATGPSLNPLPETTSAGPFADPKHDQLFADFTDLVKINALWERAEETVRRTQASLEPASSEFDTAVREELRRRLYNICTTGSEEGPKNFFLAEADAVLKNELDAIQAEDEVGSHWRRFEVGRALAPIGQVEEEGRTYVAVAPGHAADVYRYLLTEMARDAAEKNYSFTGKLSQHASDYGRRADVMLLYWQKEDARPVLLALIKMAQEHPDWLVDKIPFQTMPLRDSSGQRVLGLAYASNIWEKLDRSFGQFVSEDLVDLQAALRRRAAEGETLSPEEVLNLYRNVSMVHKWEAQDPISKTILDLLYPQATSLQTQSHLTDSATGSSLDPLTQSALNKVPTNFPGSETALYVDQIRQRLSNLDAEADYFGTSRFEDVLDQISRGELTEGPEYESARLYFEWLIVTGDLMGRLPHPDQVSDFNDRERLAGIWDRRDEIIQRYEALKGRADYQGLRDQF